MGQLCSSCVTGCQLGAEGPKKRFWFNTIKQKMFQREMTFLGQSSMLVPLISALICRPCLGRSSVAALATLKLFLIALGV